MSNIRQFTKSRYGMDWPAQAHDFYIDLVCSKKFKEEPFCQGNLLDPAEHLLRACRELFTKDQFCISPWTEQHANDWCLEDFCVTWGCASSSKAQPLDSPVYTPEGPKTMGSLKIGDRVLTHEGKTAAIIKTHDVGREKEYVVTFTDGSSTLCAGSHLWEIGSRDGVWERNRVITTEQLALSGKSRVYYVPTCEPVYFQRRKLLIDPYVLGAFLGDGCLGSSTGKGLLRFASADADIVEEIRSRLHKDYALHELSEMDFHLGKKSRKNGGRNRYIQAMREYDLWGKLSHEKHIPEDYLFNDIKRRKELLAGLLDTDGCATTKGNVSFTTASPRLAKDIKFLVHSLGGRASISEKQPYYKDATGTKVPGRLAYHVCIQLPNMKDCFKCKRKQDRVPAEFKVRNRMIESVTLTGRIVPMKCITIDHPRGLYLTDDFIVTHNSNDIGLFVLLDWMVDPTETASIMASTTLGMLELRSFESTIRYFQQLKKHPKYAFPGKYISQKHTIVLEDEAGEGVGTSAKTSIKGVAVRQGSTERARSEIQGVHTKYVRLVVDEMAQMPEAVMEARFNLAAGAHGGFKFFGLANPDSLNDLSGRFSVPVGGWSSIDLDTLEWRSQYGKVRRHDGFKSPNITEPGKYPYLIDQKYIDEQIKQANNNLEHPQIYTMIRGFPPPIGMERTVLTENMIRTFNMMDHVTWERGYTVIAGFDPAFTSDGDDPILQLARVGLDKTGSLVLEFWDTVRLDISASKGARPVTYQLADQLREHKLRYGFEWENLAVDDSGTQSVADVIDAENHCRCFRVNSASKPSEIPISTTNPNTARDLCKNKITELYYSLAEYGQKNQVRGLPSAAANQFCARRLQEKRPLALETKKDFKSRIQRSPDHADACAQVIAICREKLGVIAGATKFHPEGVFTPTIMSAESMADFNNLDQSYGSTPPRFRKVYDYFPGSSGPGVPSITVVGE